MCDLSAINLNSRFHGKVVTSTYRVVASGLGRQVRLRRSTDRIHRRRVVEIGKASKKCLAGSDVWISGVWLNPHSVVHCSAEPLFAAEIFFCRLYGHMPQ